MGNRQTISTIIVADAGPILHLFWVDALTWALPPQEIEVVETVWQEITKYEADALIDERLRRIPYVPAIPDNLARQHLDSGEEAAIAYALAQPAGTRRLLLCDDYKARLACQALTLPVMGSVGLIIEAHRYRRVSEATAITALSDLPTRGRFYVKPALIAQALTIYCKSHGFCKSFCESVCQRRNHSNADASFTIAK